MLFESARLSFAGNGNDRDQRMTPLLLKLGGWAMGAALGLAAVVLVAQSEIGAQRLAAARTALSSVGPAGPPPIQTSGSVGHKTSLESEVRRLTEAVRVLSAEQERFADRLAVIERNFAVATGSTDHSPMADKPARVAPTAQLSPTAGNPARTEVRRIDDPSLRPANVVPDVGPVEQTTLPPLALPIALPNDETAQTGASPPMPRLVPETQGSLVKPGIDLGAGTTIEELQRHWYELRIKQAELVKNLQPLISIRDLSKQMDVELRLVAGPFPTAAAAARLCTELMRVGVFCQPTEFDGQRLVPLSNSR